MSSVDDRIVNMQFNNKQFTDGVTQTQKSLEGLDRSLINTAKSKGLSTMGSQVEGVKTKFSALQVAGVAAVATIASKATAAGLNFVKSFAFGPIIAGFQEYQTNLNSVQTIMSNTGKSVKVVNSYLDKLNHYADQTVYNFSEMAKNIGTFTAAGVDLKTSTASIKGIANLAALSGSNSQQASTAMYQLSQAIAAGKVGLQDWNSVVNAGMGGKIFQKALARTAMNMGDLSKGALKLEGPMKKVTVYGQAFRQSISAAPGSTPWLTGEALVETLKQISGGYTLAELKAKGYSNVQAKEIVKLAKTAFNAATQIKTLPQLIGVVRESLGSTWAGAFRIIVGDFKQSKKLWGDVGYSIIGPSGWLTRIQDRFTHVLTRWAKLGGRDDLLAGLGNIFKSLGAIVGAFAGAWGDIFDKTSGRDLADITKSFRNFTEALIPSEKTVENLRTVFAGFFAILHIGWAVLKGIAGAVATFVSALFGGTGDIRSGVMSLLAWLSEGRIAIDKWITQGDVLTDFLKGVGETAGQFVRPIVEGIGEIVKAFGKLFQGDLDGFMEPINKIIGDVSNFASNITFGLSGLLTPFEGISQFFYDLTVDIRSFTETFDGFSIPIDWIDKLKEKIQSLNPLPSILDKFGGAASESTGIATIGMSKVGNAAGSFRDKVGGAADSVKEKLSGALDTFSGAGAKAASAGSSALASAAEGSMGVLESIAGTLSNVGPAIKGVFEAIGNAVSWVADKFSGLFGNFDATDWAATFNLIFGGMLILQVKKFVDALSGITAPFTALSDNIEHLQKVAKATLLMSIAIAVAALVGSMVLLSTLDIEQLRNGLGALALVLAMITGMMFTMQKIGQQTDENDETFHKFNGNLIALAASMVLIGLAMIAFATAVKIFGSMDLETLAKGIGAIAVMLALLIGSMFLFDKMKGNVEGMAATMLIIAVAMNALAIAVAAFGIMPYEMIAKGLGTMAIALGIIVLAMLGFDKMKSSVAGMAGAILIISVAMNVLAVAIAAFGLMDYETLAKGLGTVAIAMGIMVGSLLLLGGAGPSAILGAGAILILANAMLKLVPVILILGVTPWEIIARGIGFFAAALAVLLLAGAGAALVAPGLAILAVTVVALGAAMLLAGTGMLLFGTGFALFAAAGVAGVAVMTLAFEAFIALLPTIATQIAASIVAFLKVLANAAPKIRDSLGKIFRAMLGVISDNIPTMRRLFQKLIDNGIRVLSDSVPQFIELGFHIIDEFLKSAEKHIPSITDSAISLVTKFIDTLASRVDDIAESGANLVIETIDGIADAIDNNADDLRTAGLNLARSIIDGLTGGLLSEGIAMVQNAAARLAEAIPGPIRSFLRMNSPSKLMIDIGIGVPEGLARGILKGKMQAVGAALEVANAIAATVNGVIAPAVMNAQRLFVQKRGQAYSAQSSADIKNKAANKAQRHADELQKKANKTKDKAAKKAAEKRAKAAQHVANKLRRKADTQQEKATTAQAAADAQYQKVQDARAFEAADNLGRAQMKDDLSMDLAAQSQAMLAKANAEAAEADRLKKKNKKQSEEMRKKAKADAEEAARLAAAAQSAQADALHYYNLARAEQTAAVMDRIKSIRDEQAADAAERQWQKDYDAATTQGKKDMMEAKAKRLEDEAAAANALAAAKLAEAEAVAESDPARANALVDYAESQASLANQAANEAAQARETVAQLAQQLEQDAASGGGGGTSSGGGSTGGTTIINPSRTALEDAAKAFDRYTTSMRDAEELAASTTGVVQYVQNNYSPKALSASEVYRNTKNLLSAAEVKMGATSPTSPN